MTPQEHARDLMLRLAAMKPEERNDVTDLLVSSFQAAINDERDRIVGGLFDEAANSPCREDASVLRSAAFLVRADFSYDEAERLEVAAEKQEGDESH